MARTFRHVAAAAARAADDKKGEGIVLLHVAKTSPITDYLLLVTGSSRPHLETLEHVIGKAIEAFGLKPLHRARPASDQWRVVDFGGLVVHVMSAEARQLYQLEKLHPDAPEVDWQEPAAPKKPAKKAPARKHARTH